MNNNFHKITNIASKLIQDHFVKVISPISFMIWGEHDTDDIVTNHPVYLEHEYNNGGRDVEFTYVLNTLTLDDFKSSLFRNDLTLTDMCELLPFSTTMFSYDHTNGRGSKFTTMTGVYTNEHRELVYTSTEPGNKTFEVSSSFPVLIPFANLLSFELESDIKFLKGTVVSADVLTKAITRIHEFLEVSPDAVNSKRFDDLLDYAKNNPVINDMKMCGIDVHQFIRNQKAIALTDELKKQMVNYKFNHAFDI